MTAAISKMRFIIIISCLSFGVSFFAEAWSTNALLRAYGLTTGCLGNLVQASSAPRQGQSGADLVIFLYLSTVFALLFTLTSP
jgi:hypothetical protein